MFDGRFDIHQLIIAHRFQGSGNRRIEIIRGRRAGKVIDGRQAYREQGSEYRDRDPRRCLRGDRFLGRTKTRLPSLVVIDDGESSLAGGTESSNSSLSCPAA